MPFDKISPQMLFVMRIATGLTFVALGAALLYLAGGCVLSTEQCTTRFAAPTGSLYLFAGLNFGAFLLNAGAMLLELVTKPPLKMGINVPFVASNFQTALVVGLVALGLSVKHAGLDGAASGDVSLIQTLVFAGFALNLMFVMMTKMHWNFTANTGKALP